MMNLKKENKISVREKLLRNRLDCDIATHKCLKCDSTFGSVKTLYFHMFSIHADERVYYRCPLCAVTFVQLWTVCRHLVKVHKKSKEEANILKKSIQEMSTKSPQQPPRKGFGPALESELVTSETGKCQYCTRDFTTRANLRRHIARHLGVARYWCKLCDYKTFDRSECCSHIKKTHSKIEPSQYVTTKT